MVMGPGNELDIYQLLMPSFIWHLDSLVGIVVGSCLFHEAEKGLALSATKH